MFGDAGREKKSTRIEFRSTLCLLNEMVDTSLTSSELPSPEVYCGFLREGWVFKW